MILQAAAAAMIEEYCDRVCRELKAAYEAKGLYLQPRFSPGYGDFPLECQPYLLECVDGGKQLGIRLTGGYLMMPSKSVTAVMGLEGRPAAVVKGCEACGKGLRLSAANRKRGLRNEHFTGNETAAPVLTAVWEAFCRLRD